jgi:hypothetical protein
MQHMPILPAARSSRASRSLRVSISVDRQTRANATDSSHTAAREEVHGTSGQHASAVVSVSVHNNTVQVVTSTSHSSSNHVDMSVRESRSEQVEQHVSDRATSLHFASGVTPAPDAHFASRVTPDVSSHVPDVQAERALLGVLTRFGGREMPSWGSTIAFGERTRMVPSRRPLSTAAPRNSIPRVRSWLGWSVRAARSADGVSCLEH